MSSSRLTKGAAKTLSEAVRMGTGAEESLREDSLSAEEYVSALSALPLKKMGVARAEELARPLLVRDARKLIQGSYLKSRSSEIFDDVYSAAVDGLHRGLLKFDGGSRASVSYIFQWSYALARSELISLEASPTGISSAKMVKFRKIAAVRHKLSDSLGRDAADEEIVDYFHSGRAKSASMQGPKGRAKDGVAQVNKDMTVELVREQGVFEADHILSTDVYNSQVAHEVSVSSDPVPFGETLFGRFLAEHGCGFTDSAVAVLKSDLGEYDVADADVISSLSGREYCRVLRLWRIFLSSRDTVFVRFLEEQDDDPVAAGIVKDIRIAGNFYDKEKTSALLREED